MHVHTRVARLVAVIAIAAAGRAPAAPVGSAASADAPFRFGAHRATISDLESPTRVVFGDDDAFWVLETGRDRIVSFGADGARRGIIGRTGSGPGEMLRPADFARWGPTGEIFVADTGNHRVQVLAPDGAFARAWGKRGTGQAAFNAPTAIAVTEALVFVADAGNRRVQVFDHQGNFVRAFGAETVDTGDGPRAARGLGRPGGIAVDPAGFVLVTDGERDRIHRFDSDGAHVGAFGDPGAFPGLLDRPTGIVGHDGLVLVADTRNHRLQSFRPDGTHVETWGEHARRPREGAGKLHYPSAVAIAPSGTFAVICEPFENRVQTFDRRAADAPAPTFSLPQHLGGHFGGHLAVDGRLLTLIEPDNDRLHLFETSGEIPIVIGDVGERGRRYGQMLGAAGVTLDQGDGTLLLADPVLRRLQRFRFEFDPDEPRRYTSRRLRFSQAVELDRRVDHAARGLSWPVEPAGVARGPDGRRYVLDPRNDVVLVFDATLAVVEVWGGHGTAPGRLRHPTTIAVDAAGERIYVVDADNARVQVFDRDGNVVDTWGERGDGPGAFQRPFGIAIDADGRVYVTDAVLHRVQRFAADGTYETSWGGLGVEHGELWKPKGVAVDARGRVIVVDHGNHRAQIFDADGTWLVTFGTGRAYTRRDTERAAPAEDAR